MIIPTVNEDMEHTELSYAAGWGPRWGASLVAQLVKNLPAMWETWVQTLGWEDPLEKETATHSSILAWRIPWTYSLWDGKESDTTEQLSLFHFHTARRV